jgi:hypothetical protein
VASDQLDPTEKGMEHFAVRNRIVDVGQSFADDEQLEAGVFRLKLRS